MCAIKRHATWVINTRKHPSADPMFFRKKGWRGGVLQRSIVIAAEAGEMGGGGL